MRFTYHARHRYGDTYSYSLARIQDWCCHDMEKAVEDGFVGIGPKEWHDCPEPCIYQCSPYPEGAVWDDMEIRFCPFCGDSVEVVAA